MINRSTYQEIQGWLDEREARALQLIAEDQRVTEIGCWKAKSSIAMAATARSVLSIDHFKGDAYAGPAFTLTEAIENIRTHDVGNKISLLIQDFFCIDDHKILELISASDVLYYDGDHSGESVEKLVKFLDTIDRGSFPIVAFHDYESSPVYQAGKDIFDSFVSRLKQSGYDSDCLVVVHRLAIIVPPRISGDIKEKLLGITNE